MYIIDSPSHDAYFNIALEEYLLYKYPTEDIFLLYVNDPSIIVGKFQNTLAEINLNYVESNNIKVVRRMSGGGSVYHDLGNLNFSFHTLLGSNDFMDFSKFTEPIVTLLNELEVPAKLEGRNDLLVDGKKFSGNAKLARNGKMIQHGTILFNSEMNVLGDALKVNPLKFVDKAVKSNRARVTNLAPYLPEGMITDDLKELLIEVMLETNEDAIIYELTSEDKEGVQQLINEKYSTWDWNFGFSPKYNFKNAKKIPAGFIEVHLDVDRGGIIEKAKIFGDFFASKPIEEFEEMLIGKNHNFNELNLFFDTIDLTAFFGKVEKEEILDLFK
ncbi:lipoate--protein ligase [Faecalibacter bovis]|uniref:lipoate--protein ligase n=1 Tax=Faecalibacter bovis TaxID=2898187 RepID=A0ABX7XCC6_9FLAO|nr:lipoate--protein ligase [Faecalibacter bovis]QTV05566.1 lipoate--protein ligase [Faecalibacter bovis]